MKKMLIIIIKNTQLEYASIFLVNVPYTCMLQYAITDSHLSILTDCIFNFVIFTVPNPQPDVVLDLKNSIM